jgi:hypothetical protein
MNLPPTNTNNYFSISSIFKSSPVALVPIGVVFSAVSKSLASFNPPGDFPKSL